MRWLDGIDRDALHVSVLTLGEIAGGVAREMRRDPVVGASLETWFGGIRAQFAKRTLPVDLEIARIWGRLNAARPLPPVDALLAATAIARGMVLVTRNARDIADTGVAYLDPWAG